MRIPSCPHTLALHRLLLAAEPDVVRRGFDARTRGPAWGVLVALPEELGAETAEEAAELAAAREPGFYVGVIPVVALLKMVPAEGDPALAAIRHQLSQPAAEDQVHVLGILGDAVATVTVHATAELVAQRNAEAD